MLCDGYPAEMWKWNMQAWNNLEGGCGGKKGVSDQNVENVAHIEVIMVPQKSECNLDSLVEGGWQSACGRGSCRHVDIVFSVVSAQGQMSPEVLGGGGKCSESATSWLVVFYLGGMCQFWNIFLMTLGSQGKNS